MFTIFACCCWLTMKKKKKKFCQCVWSGVVVFVISFQRVSSSWCKNYFFFVCGRLSRVLLVGWTSTKWYHTTKSNCYIALVVYKVLRRIVSEIRSQVMKANVENNTILFPVSYLVALKLLVRRKINIIIRTGCLSVTPPLNQSPRKLI